MPIPYQSRPRPEPRLHTCSALLRKRGTPPFSALSVGPQPHRPRASGPASTLCIDIGGTGIKMIVLDPEGHPINERARELTPKPATPQAMLEVIRHMVKA